MQVVFVKIDANVTLENSLINLLLNNVDNKVANARS